MDAYTERCGIVADRVVRVDGTVLSDTTYARCKPYMAIELGVACGAVSSGCFKSGLRDRRAWGANSTTGHRKFAELVRHLVFTGASSCLVRAFLYCIVANAFFSAFTDAAKIPR